LGKEGTKDYQTAQWAASQLQQEQEKPFFMAVGISRPHLPFYAPQEFFDLYDPKGEYAPPMRDDDLEDILTPEGKKKFKPSNDYLWLKQNDLFDEAARAYLAASSYADACLGVIFDALKKSPHYDNTIVMVWGDHGWHLGEKLRYRKAALWTEATRMPLMVRLPGMNRRQDCERVVNMIDFYPTLIELCQLPQKPVLDGRSFAPLLANPNRDWNYPTMTINGSGNVSIHDERWHYIEYRDGTQELYDLQHDPQEWTNLVLQLTETSSSAMKRLQRYAPKKFAPSISNSKNRHPKSNGLDLTIKVTRDLAKLK
jgi:arylsulfatase A-like enzyme